MGSRAIEGRVRVRKLEGRILETRAEGYLSRRVVAAALRELDTYLSDAPGRFHFLSDATAIDGFDPGSPIIVVRWAASHADRYHRSAIIARQPTLVAVTRTFQYLLPTIPIGVFATDGEAMAYLDDPLAPESVKLPGKRATALRTSGTVRIDRPSRRARSA